MILRVIKWSYWFSTTISPKSLISQWFTLSLCSIVICRLKYRLSQIAKNLQLSVKIQIEARLQAVETFTFYTQYPIMEKKIFFFFCWKRKPHFHWCNFYFFIIVPPNTALLDDYEMFGLFLRGKNGENTESVMK